MQTIFPVPEPYAAVTAAIGAIVATLVNVRWLRKKNVASLTKITQPAISRRGAAQTYEASRHLIDDPGLPVGERKKVMLNLARAAIVAGTAGDAPDGLVQAADLLRQLIADQPANWTDLMGAATELADASFRKAVKHGDFSGYEEVLVLLAKTAEQMPPDSEAQVIVLQKRAEYQLKLASQVPEGPEAMTQIWQAIASWREAIAASPPPKRDRLRVMHSDIGEAIARAYPYLADPRAIWKPESVSASSRSNWRAGRPASARRRRSGWRNCSFAGPSSEREAHCRPNRPPRSKSNSDLRKPTRPKLSDCSGWPPGTASQRFAPTRRPFSPMWPRFAR
ncbi:MAG TPA: hypothetical protein VFI65_06880 [Streptosporangiaceae bacterium]|nr:hypothetical protein [Streptosporangiaceae bacterium]